MEKDETHAYMNEIVETIDSHSEALFIETDGDLLITGIVASKEYGQMIIQGPLDTRNALGMMLTVIAGGGCELKCFDEQEHAYLSKLAAKLIEVH